MSGERDIVEFKEFASLSDQRSALSLVKEIVAMANSLGGEVRIGICDDGRPSDRAAHIDPAKLCDKVDSFIAPDHLEVQVDTSLNGGIVRLIVPQAARPPLVISKDGTFGQGTDQRTMFRRGDVLVRVGTKAQAASRQHHLDWREAAVEEERERFLRNVQYVARMPSDARLQVLTGDDELDEPDSLLRRAARDFLRNSEKLLTANELLHLLCHADALQPAEEGWTVLIQSSLRKRSTLWHWVSMWDPAPADVRDQLERAIAGTDRDKSDAGAAIVDLAAVFLDDTQYVQITAQLASSSYSHFRAAVEDNETLTERRARVCDKIASATAPPTAEAIRAASTRLCTELLNDPTIRTGRRAKMTQLAQLGQGWFRLTHRWTELLSHPGATAAGA